MKKPLFKTIFLFFFSFIFFTSMGCNHEDSKVTDSKKKQTDDSLNIRQLENHKIDSLIVKYDELLKVLERIILEDKFPGKVKTKFQDKQFQDKFYKDFGIVQDELIEYRKTGKMTSEQIELYKLLGKKHIETINIF